MNPSFHRSILVASLAVVFACGPSVGEDDEGGTADGDATAGPGEPLACYDEPGPNPGDSECCPGLSQPCPAVQHECLDEAVCNDVPFGGSVMDPAAAQCMLAALAEGVTGRFDQTVVFGMGNTDQQWLVNGSGDVILVYSYLQDLYIDVSFTTCRLVDAQTLSACAAESDPQALSECLSGAVEGCEEVTDPLCPG